MNRNSYKPHPVQRRNLLRMAGGLAMGAAPLAVGLGLGANVQAQERSAMEKIRDSGVLKIALYKENAPWSDGSIAHMTGLDVSLGEALAAALQLKPALLHLADLMLQLRKPVAQLGDFVLALQHAGGTGFDFVAQLVGGGLLLVDLGLQHVELVARQLGIEVLEFE